MNRRDTLKNMMMASGTLLALPAWAEGWTVRDIIFTSSFSSTEQELLASVADTIIPAGDSVGALSVGVDKFLQKLIEDCYEQKVVDQVKAQLTGLDASAKSAYGQSFSACDQAQRQELLLALSVSENSEEADFLKLIKDETIRGFRTSKEVMTKYYNYKVAPGYYHGCVDINQ